MPTFSELVIGAMPFSHGSWFVKLADNWTDWRQDCPDDYWVEIGYTDEEGQRPGSKRLTAADLVAAAERIERGETSLTANYVKEITAALRTPEIVDLDAATADAVLQTAVYGNVRFG